MEPERSDGMRRVRKPELLQKMLQANGNCTSPLVAPVTNVQPTVGFDQTHYKSRPALGPPAATPQTAIQATFQNYRVPELPQQANDNCTRQFVLTLMNQQPIVRPPAATTVTAIQATSQVYRVPALSQQLFQANGNCTSLFVPPVMNLQPTVKFDQVQYKPRAAQGPPAATPATALQATSQIYRVPELPQQASGHCTNPSVPAASPETAIQATSQACRVPALPQQLFQANGNCTSLFVPPVMNAQPVVRFDQMQYKPRTAQGPLAATPVTALQATSQVYRVPELPQQASGHCTNPSVPAATPETAIQATSQACRVPELPQQVEQLNQEKLQMDSEINKLRTEVQEVMTKMKNTATASSSRDERHQYPPELSPEHFRNDPVTVSERGVLPYGNNNGVNITVHEGQSINKSKTGNSTPQNSTGPEWLDIGSTSAATTLTDTAVIQDSGASPNVHASQQGPKDYYYHSSITTPAVDYDKDYYHKHCKVLRAKVKQLESQLAVTLIQQKGKKTSQACIQTDPVSEPAEDSSKIRLVSQYEEAMKEIQILKQKHETLQKLKSEAESIPAKEPEVQNKREVNKRPVLVDQVLSQRDACCNELDLYKAEVEQLKQQKLELESKNSQLQTELEELRNVTQIPSSTDTSREESMKLRNLRMNVADLLTMLAPSLNFQHLNSDDAIDGILQEVLKETKK